mmetsp:Transcript_99417/g.309770  ORF Transcript_99417/g.309770 Transcript_99417/m.309770 type:complete len:87 (+) Transcript_99417:81-341(+)
MKRRVLGDTSPLTGRGRTGRVSPATEEEKEMDVVGREPCCGSAVDPVDWSVPPSFAAVSGGDMGLISEAVALSRTGCSSRAMPRKR